MDRRYIIKNPEELEPFEIKLITEAWQIPEFKDLTNEAFVQRFERSEFHLLYTENELSAVSRINFDFTIGIAGGKHNFAELVGLVSVEQKKGFGSHLLKCITENVRRRDFQAIGFCEIPLRPFYKKCGLRILYGKAKFLFEYAENNWLPSSDDDIIDLNLTPANCHLLESLSSNNPGFLFFNGSDKQVQT